MSAQTIQVEYETLKEIAQRFDRNAERQAAALQRIRQQMEALRASWRGQAAERFFGEMEGELLPAYGRLVDALEQSAATTREIARLLREAEEEAALFKGETTKSPIEGQDRAPAPVAVATDDSTRLGGAKVWDGERPPPVIFFINGINSQGPYQSPDGSLLRDAAGNIIYGDDQSVALEQLFEAHGYDPDLAISTSPVYVAPNYFSGTSFNGIYIGRNSDFYQTTTRWAEGINRFTDRAADMVNGPINSLAGAGQVFHEYMNPDGSGHHSQLVYDEMIAQLENMKLLPNQQIVIIPHSGGGAIAANAARRLAVEGGYEVGGIVTMGSPVSDYELAMPYVEKIVDVRHVGDGLGGPYIRDGGVRHFLEGGWIPRTGFTDLWWPDAPHPRSSDGSAVTTVILGTPSTDPHGSYMHDPAVSRELIERLRREFPEMQLEPWPTL